MTDSRLSFRAKNVDLIVYDFDGVMTDNRVIIFQDGAEAVIVNRADGLGVDRFRSLGIPQLILSTETNTVVKARAAKLCIEVIASCKDKKIALENYCAQKGYDLNRVIYVGNDINDLEAMKIVGYPIAPADAHVEVKKIARIITKTIGGDGVIRELLDIFMEDKL
ncbi:2-keto-3-deoxy-D-glycero-D-galacto-9-phosphonononic acid phosphatase [subsurface metagenome]